MKLDIDVAVHELLAAETTRKRMELAKSAGYAESGPTFDPSGNYLCGTCSFRLMPDKCAIVRGDIDMQTGGCIIYHHGPEFYDKPLAHQFPQEQVVYTERPNVKGFGCKRCEYGKEDGTKCEQWEIDVEPNACCYANEGPDDVVAPGDKTSVEVSAYGTSEGVRKSWESRQRAAYADEVAQYEARELSNKNFREELNVQTKEITPNSGWDYLDTPKGPATLLITNAHDHKGTLEIHWLIAMKRGAGRAAMERMVELADKHHVRLGLWAVPLPGQGENQGFRLTKAHLERWYRQFGFKLDHKEKGTNNSYLVREPKTLAVLGYGTSEGALKGWDTRGRVVHPQEEHRVDLDIFNRPEHPNQYAPSVERYFDKPVPSKAQIEDIVREFKTAREAEPRLLKLSDLSPMQETVYLRGVMKMFDPEKTLHVSKKAEAKWLTKHIPTVFHFHGNNYVMDGHHHVVMYDLMKRKEVRVRYFEPRSELDAYGTSEGVTKAWDTRGRGQKEEPVDPKKLQAAVEQWQRSPELIKNRAEQIITTGQMQSDVYSQYAKDLLDGIHSGEETTSTIYRGMHFDVGGVRGKDILALKAGDEFQSPAPQSFSTNLGSGESFSIGTKPPGQELHVMMQIEGGSKGIDAEQANPKTEQEGYGGEDEFITNGRFKVTNVEDTKLRYSKEPLRIIHMQHLGLL